MSETTANDDAPAPGLPEAPQKKRRPRRPALPPRAADRHSGGGFVRSLQGFLVAAGRRRQDPERRAPGRQPAVELLRTEGLDLDCLDAWHDAGERLVADLSGRRQRNRPQGVDAPGSDPQPPAWRRAPIAAAALARSAYRPAWLIHRLLVAHQPTILGGRRKSLKTTLLVDLAIALAAGVPYLGTYTVPRAVRVALLSGELGGWALRETSLRVCAARGMGLDSLDARLPPQDSLPHLSDADQVAALERLTNPCAVAEFASIQAGPAIPECWRIQLPQTES